MNIAKTDDAISKVSAMVELNMMNNLFDHCLIARVFLGARNRHNSLYFKGLHWSYLFDGCLIQGESLRQGQTVAEGFPKPIIHELGLWVRFVFTLVEKIVVEERAQSQPESLAARVLMLLEAGSLSKSQLAAGFRQKAVSGQLNKVIRELLRREQIEYTIPEKPDCRLQKYRLTEKGRRALEDRA